MLRFCLAAAFIATVAALKCKSGVDFGLDSQKIYNSSVVTCANGTKYCLKEKIQVTGETGHTIMAINYSCDFPSPSMPGVTMCTSPMMVPLMNNNTCNSVKDLYIGNVCCCSSDNCNVDHPLRSGYSPSLLLSLVISFVFFS